MARPERHVRVRAADFSPERLDTGFYARAYFDTREAIRGSGLKTESIGSVCEPWQFGAYALCNHIEWSNAASGVPYIKAEALGSPLLNESGLAYVTPATHRLLEKSRLKPGDIVVSTSGTIGLCAVLPERLGEANSNQDTIKFNPSSAGYDCYFIAAWIASAPGQVFLHREAGGAVQQHVYLYNFKRLPLLKIAAEAQRYIGDKVRQAERLRERARRLCESARLHHLGWIPEFRPSKPKWNTYTVAPRAIEDVIVPHFYPPAVTEYLAGRHSRSLGQLCENVYSGETYDPDDRGVDQATSRSCSGRFLRRPCNRVRPPTRTDLNLQPHDLLLTNAAHDKGYIGTDVTYYHGGPRNIPSAKVMVLRPNRNLVPASYVFTYLQTPVGYLQIQSAIRGISAGIRAQDVASIRIPLPTLTEQERVTWVAMDSQMAEADAAEESAGPLCAAASQLVEQLIGGRLTEADLVAAQKALEAGGRSADREILKALRQSDAPDAKPLIADVDALYALLDGSEGQDA